MSAWECREDDTDPAMSWIERGTGENCERFLSVPLNYEDACKVEELLARADEFRAALTMVAKLQPEALRIIEANGFIFDAIGREPGNWQHLAFTLYTNICEAEQAARGALEAE